MWLIFYKIVYNNCVIEDNLIACLNVTKKIKTPAWVGVF